DDTAGVIKPVVCAGQFDGVGGKAAYGVIVRATGDLIREVGDLEEEGALPGVELRRLFRAGVLGASAPNPRRLRLFEDAANPRVGILNVEHRVFVALLGGEVEVKVERSVVMAHQVEKPGHVPSGSLFFRRGPARFDLFTDLVDEVDE